MPGVVFETERPREAADFWAALLGGELVGDGYGGDGHGGDYGGGGLRVRLPDGFTVRIVGATTTKAAKNRIHLDLASDGDGGAGRGAQQAIVDRAVRLGAARVDIGQYAGPVAVPWQVLADPAGNEFCVLEPRPEYAATGALAAVVVESPDPHRLAEFWSSATRWPIVRTDPEIVSLRAPGGRGPWLELLAADPCPPATPRCRLELTVPAGDPESTTAGTAATGTATTGTEAAGTVAAGTEESGVVAATEAPEAAGAVDTPAAWTRRPVSAAPGAFAAEADRLCLLGATRRGAGRLVDPDGTVIDLVPHR
ncbi:VOC family protein [Prauserella alba]|nr:VOC family protein [Prauserella alba]